MSAALRVAVATLVTIALTWLFGWWAVAPVALVAGSLPLRARLGGASMALASALAWGVLLARQASHAHFGTLLDRVESALRLPSLALVVVALLFPALLGWAGATLGGLLATSLARNRRATIPGTA